MVFTREVFTVVRPLDHVQFQSLVNYSSSRVRAATNALAMRLSGIPKGDHNNFVVGLGREVSAGNALIGLGIMLFDDSMIRPPSALRSMTPLVIQNRLLDWSAISLAVKGGRDSGDDLLAHYENCWWNPFNEKTDVDRFRQRPIDIIRAWQLQRMHMPAPLTLPSRGMIALQGLADDELDRAWLVGSDSLKALDEEMAVNQQTIADVTAMLVKCRANLEDLVAEEERLLKANEGAIDALREKEPKRRVREWED